MEVTKGECLKERRSGWRKREEAGIRNLNFVICLFDLLLFFNLLAKINLSSFLNFITELILLSFLKAREFFNDISV